MKVDMVVETHIRHPASANKVNTTIVNAPVTELRDIPHKVIDSFSIQRKQGNDLEGKKIAIVGIRHWKLLFLYSGSQASEPL